jgi:ribose/xylose/arabinose/galactoside ABC-type transport system permease subunit
MSTQSSRMTVLQRIARQREYGVLALLALTVIVVSLVNPSFGSWQNVSDMLFNATPALIVGCGMTLVIVTGEIDISVGSLMGLCAAVLGLLTSQELNHKWPIWAAVLTVLALGAGIGLVNGLLTTVGKVPSIIVTLGMLTALRGITQLIMGGEWIKGLPQELRFLGTGSLVGVPIPVLTALVVAICFIIITLRTPLGRRTYAVGSNPRSARLAGISETRIKIIAFVLTGLLTALATVVYVPKLSVIDAERGKAFELLVVTCVVVGGTSISGGKGTIVGTVSRRRTGSAPSRVRSSCWRCWPTICSPDAGGTYDHRRNAASNRNSRKASRPVRQAARFCVLARSCADSASSGTDDLGSNG